MPELMTMNKEKIQKPANARQQKMSVHVLSFLGPYNKSLSTPRSSRSTRSLFIVNYYKYDPSVQLAPENM